MQIWDVGRMKQIRALKGHSARVSALAWSGTTLSSGGRDSNIINHDVRCDKPFAQKVPSSRRLAPLAGEALQRRAFSHANAVCLRSGYVWGMVVLLALDWRLIGSLACSGSVSTSWACCGATSRKCAA